MTPYFTAEQEARIREIAREESAAPTATISRGAFLFARTCFSGRQDPEQPARYYAASRGHDHA